VAICVSDSVGVRVYSLYPCALTLQAGNSDGRGLQKRFGYDQQSDQVATQTLIQ